MHRLVALAVAALCLSPLAAAAQAATPSNFIFCTLADTGRVPAQIWASPVFEFAVPAHDAEVLNRLAGEFHRHVAGLGGAGDKSCVALATRAEADAFRQQQYAIWDKRMYFIKVGNWHDVAWTPPAGLASAPETAANVSRHFRCYATTTDVPGRVDLAWTVSSGVFEMPVSGERSFAAALEQANAYQEEFKAVAQAHRIPAEATMCSPYDTLAEAEKAEHDYHRLIGGFNTRYTVTPWLPSGKAAAPPAPPSAVKSAVAGEAGAPFVGLKLEAVSNVLAQAMGLTAGKGAWVVGVIDGSAASRADFKPMDVVLEISGQAVEAPSDVPAILSQLRAGFEAPVQVWRERGPHLLKLVVPGGAVAPVVDQASSSAAASGTTVPAAADATSAPVPATPRPLYCLAVVQRTKPALLLRTPVHQLATADGSLAAVGATLGALYSAVKQQYPGKWRDDEAKCYDNSRVIAGERLCMAISNTHLGGLQSVLLYCNATQEGLASRLAEMDAVKDVSGLQVLEWPTGI